MGSRHEGRRRSRLGERALGAALLALGLLCVPVGARAQEALEAADRAYEEGRLADAARSYEQALVGGGLDSASLVRTHLRLGILAALAGEDAREGRHFEAALALDPARDAPEELSSEVRARYDALRDARDGRRLVLRVSLEESALVIRVDDAPSDLARTIIVRGARREQRLAWEGTPIRLEAPPDAAPFEAVVLDAHGNRLARAGRRLAPLPDAVSVLAPEAAARSAEEDRESGHSLIETPWLWVVVGIVVIGIAVTVGVSASGDRYVLDPPVVR